MTGLSLLPPGKPDKALRFTGRVPRHLRNLIAKHPILCKGCQKEQTHASLLCAKCLRDAKNEQRRRADWERAHGARLQREEEHAYGDHLLRPEDLRAPASLPPRISTVEDYDRELSHLFPFPRERDLFQRLLDHRLHRGPFNTHQFAGRYNLGSHVAEALDLDPRLEHVPQRGGRQRWRLREGISSDLATALDQLSRTGPPPDTDTGDAHA